MTGMKCDECELLLEYKVKVVAVYEEGGRLRAKLVNEDSPGAGEAARLGATLKFHPPVLRRRASEQAKPARS